MRPGAGAKKGKKALAREWPGSYIGNSFEKTEL
jgi:hypothetical protein